LVKRLPLKQNKSTTLLVKSTMSFIKGYCAFIFYYISINKSFFKSVLAGLYEICIEYFRELICRIQGFLIIFVAIRRNLKSQCYEEYYTKRTKAFLRYYSVLEIWTISLFRNNVTNAHALLYMQIYSIERGLLYII